MRLFLLISLTTAFCFLGQAQSTKVKNLPAGRYESVVKQTKKQWSNGDIIILDEQHYKTSVNDTLGNYKFSITAQRVFFLSGSLKSVYAKTLITNNQPSIILPFTENSRQGIDMVEADILAVLKKP